jgi:DNA-binding NtrC family response regulator
MPGQIVLVHNILGFANEAAAALRDAGYEVAVFTDPMQALAALDAAKAARLLITRVNYPSGKPHGVALALMARNRCPDIRVVFTARADMEPHTQGIGQLLSMPVSIADLVAVVAHLLPQPAASPGVAPAPAIRNPVIQLPVSGAPDRLREFSWPTRRLLRLAATTIARSHQLQLAASRRCELARALRTE